MEAAVREDRVAQPRFGIPRVVEGRVDRERRLRRIRRGPAEACDPPGSLERELNAHVSVREGVVCEPGKDESPSERLRGSRRKRELVLRPVGLASITSYVLSASTRRACASVHECCGGAVANAPAISRT